MIGKINRMRSCQCFPEGLSVFVNQHKDPIYAFLGKHTTLLLPWNIMLELKTVSDVLLIHIHVSDKYLQVTVFMSKCNVQSLISWRFIYKVISDCFRTLITLPIFKSVFQSCMCSFLKSISKNYSLLKGIRFLIERRIPLR